MPIHLSSRDLIESMAHQPGTTVVLVGVPLIELSRIVDYWGHVHAETVLARVEAAARASGGSVYRIGAREFGATTTLAPSVARERVAAVLAEPLRLTSVAREEPVVVTPSWRLAAETYPGPPTDAESFLVDLDNAARPVAFP